MLVFYFPKFKQNFKKKKFETKNENGVNLKIFTNWFEFYDGYHNLIRINRGISHSGLISTDYYFEENRSKRIDSVIKVEWLKNDSLIIIHSKLKNMEKKIDSLYWLKMQE